MARYYRNKKTASPYMAIEEHPTRKEMIRFTIHQDVLGIFLLLVTFFLAALVMFLLHTPSSQTTRSTSAFETTTTACNNNVQIIQGLETLQRNIQQQFQQFIEKHRQLEQQHMNRPTGMTGPTGPTRF